MAFVGPGRRSLRVQDQRHQRAGETSLNGSRRGLGCEVRRAKEMIREQADRAGESFPSMALAQVAMERGHIGPRQ